MAGVKALPTGRIGGPSPFQIPSTSPRANPCIMERSPRPIDPLRLRRRLYLCLLPDPSPDIVSFPSSLCSTPVFIFSANLTRNAHSNLASFSARFRVYTRYNASCTYVHCTRSSFSFFLFFLTKFDRDTFRVFPHFQRKRQVVNAQIFYSTVLSNRGQIMVIYLFFNVSCIF